MCQSVRQGAVNPTSYNSMNDNSGLTPDHLYKLTNKLLCQLYYNNRAQYAHKRAFLVGKSLHRELCHSEVHQDTRGFRKVNFKLSIQILLACFVSLKGQIFYLTPEGLVNCQDPTKGYNE